LILQGKLKLQGKLTLQSRLTLHSNSSGAALVDLKLHSVIGKALIIADRIMPLEIRFRKLVLIAAQEISGLCMQNMPCFVVNHYFF
jgi:hypothetical protein